MEDIRYVWFVDDVVTCVPLSLEQRSGHITPVNICASVIWFCDLSMSYLLSTTLIGRVTIERPNRKLNFSLFFLLFFRFNWPLLSSIHFYYFHAVGEIWEQLIKKLHCTRTTHHRVKASHLKIGDCLFNERYNTAGVNINEWQCQKSSLYSCCFTACWFEKVMAWQ